MTIANSRGRPANARRITILRLCHEAGLVKLGVVALDGTKVAANAALATNRSHQAIEEEVQRMLAEATAADAEEDAHYGPARRGDELPEGLGGRRERLKRLKEAKDRLQREAEAAAKAVQEHVEQRRAEEVATGKKKRGRKPKVVMGRLRRGWPVMGLSLARRIAVPARKQERLLGARQDRGSGP